VQVSGDIIGIQPTHHLQEGIKMTIHDNVYKIIQLTGSSSNSIEEAINNAISRAGQTIRQMRWFEVLETRGVIGDGKVETWQVTIKIGFTLEEE
jgi:dodecin